MTQIGNNTSKSGVSIQSKTALNVGEMESLATDQLEAIQQREHREIRETFWVREQVRDEDVSIKKEKKRANVATTRRTRPILASVLQYCSNCEIGILQAMDPTFH